MYKIKLQILILLCLVSLGAFLRIYRISDYPVHLNHDEISQLYDAISLSQTTKDIYNNFLPTIFVSTNDYKSPFYTYTTVLNYWIFGGAEYVIRITSVFFGILIIPAVYLFSLKLLRNRQIALFGALITAISPFELFFSRKSFENGAGIFFMLLGFLFLLTFLEQGEKKRWLYFGVMSLGVGMYTYFSHAMIIPPLLLIFIYIFRHHFKKLSIKFYLPVILFFLLLITPLMLIIQTNQGSKNRSQAVFVTQDTNLSRQIEYSQSDSPLLSFLQKQKVVLDFSFDRYLNQFNPTYLFLDGLDLTNQGPIGSGPLLFVQLPLLFAGLLFLTRKQELSGQKKFILSWILIGLVPSGLTFEPHSPHRVIMVFTMLNIISAVGLYFIIQKFSQQSLPKLAKLGLPIIIALGFIINFIYFIHIYTINFPYEKSQYLHYPFEQIAKFAWSEYSNFDQIVFDPVLGESAPFIGTAVHYYLAYYGNYSPQIFQEEYRFGQKEREVLFGKFSIRKVEWLTDRDLKNTLLLVSPWSAPIKDIDKAKIMKVFYYYDGVPAFYAVKL